MADLFSTLGLQTARPSFLKKAEGWFRPLIFQLINFPSTRIVIVKSDAFKASGTGCFADW
jgi:hypothetical protein